MDSRILAEFLTLQLIVRMHVDSLVYGQDKDTFSNRLSIAFIWHYFQSASETLHFVQFCEQDKI